MNAQAPITSAKLGSTRCVGCERLFADDGRPIVLTEAEVPNGHGVSSSGKAYRRLGTHKVSRRWHADCHEAHLAFEVESRARAEADRQASLAAMLAAIEGAS